MSISLEIMEAPSPVRYQYLSAKSIVFPREYVVNLSVVTSCHGFL